MRYLGFLKRPLALGLTLAAGLAAVPNLPAQAQDPVSLTPWQVATYPDLPGAPPETAVNWSLSATTFQATQSGNSQLPTFFFSDFEVRQHRLTAEIRVEPGSGDNDWIGFVLGFDPGETSSSAAEYLFLDWKKDLSQLGENQGIVPGMAINRAFGIPAVPDFSNHVDTAISPAGGVQELDRATQLGTVGWEEGRTYAFEFELRPERLRIWVDGALEFDLDPASNPALPATFEEGRFGCYSFSQPGTTCGPITVEPLADLPSLAIDGGISAHVGQEVSVPVRLMPQGNTLLGADFRLDLDTACLGFDPADADADGIPEAVELASTISPADFLVDVDFDPARTEGELGISLLGLGNATPFLGGDLVTFRLQVLCGPAPGEAFRESEIAFMPDSITFADFLGRSILAGDSQDGSVNILAAEEAPGPIDFGQRSLLFETYPFGLGSAPLWVSPYPEVLAQTRFPDPTIALLDVTLANHRATFEVKVETFRDDDFFGFVLGYQPGDFQNPAADYLLVDWKKEPQLPVPGLGIVGGTRGLALSRVFGVPSAGEFFDHSNLGLPFSSLADGLEELARGSSLGDAPWVGLVPPEERIYTFELEYSSDRLRLFVDGVLELDLAGTFPPRSFGFYNNSQQQVFYQNLVIETLD